MNEFNYGTRQKYLTGLVVINDIGVDYEADPNTLTIVTDELSSAEYESMRHTTK